MVLISAAALYSDKGHGQVLAALELARSGRRRLNRFGWLVDLAAAGTFEQEAEEEAGIEDEDDDFMRSISLRKPKAGRQSGHHPAESMPDRAARMGLICDVLVLVNALIGSPQELRQRVGLRGEFLRLQFLSVLSYLHRQNHADIARQVEVFETELQSDNGEIALLSDEGKSALPGRGEQPSGIDGVVPLSSASAAQGSLALPTGTMCALRAPRIGPRHSFRPRLRFMGSVAMAPPLS